MATELLTREVDLSDPVVLQRELGFFADGMWKQADSARFSSGVIGHPSPEWFFGQVARVLDAALMFMKRCEGGERPAPAPVPASVPAPVSVSVPVPAPTSASAAARVEVPTPTPTPTPKEVKKLDNKFGK